ncbi:MAG: glutamate mutase L [Anaerolineae bacterium]|nr:glutamate mutase L [Anaerolineae bacterium]
MISLNLETDSLLAMEIGSISTRALLFDTVEGRYRFLAAGIAPTTANAPLHDVSEGVRLAMDQLQRITGRKFISADEQLIMPSTPLGEGVDIFASTISAGQPLRILAIGLLDKVSLDSIRHLVGTINAHIVRTISLNDGLRAESQIDAILQTRPDVVIIAGGTNQGASRSVLNMVNALGMALHLMPEEIKPEVLYVGNESIAENVSSFLEPLTHFWMAPNIRPTLETELLGPAEIKLTEIFRKIQTRKVLGVQELDTWSGGKLLPTSSAFGRVIRFLSKVYDVKKGVLGLDVGASATTVATAHAGQLRVNVVPQLGMGVGLPSLLDHHKLEEITRWLPLEVPDEQVVNYLHNKPLYPASLPATQEDLAIEQAVARTIMRTAFAESQPGFPQDMPLVGSHYLLDPILISGSVIAQAPSLAQSLLMILDGIEPVGISRIILDKNNITPALGAAASLNSVLAVQVLDSNSYVNMGTVVAPIGKARHGSSVIRVKVQYDTGQENAVDVKFGTIKLIPLPPGRIAQLHLQPLQRFDIGMGGRGKSGRLRVVGGTFGVIIDARGRPLTLPKSPERRRELLNSWYRALKV